MLAFHRRSSRPRRRRRGKAAGLLIVEHHDADADRTMTDRAIAGIGRLN